MGGGERLVLGNILSQARLINMISNLSRVRLDRLSDQVKILSVRGNSKRTN